MRDGRTLAATDKFSYILKCSNPIVVVIVVIIIIIIINNNNIIIILIIIIVIIIMNIVKSMGTIDNGGVICSQSDLLTFSNLV